MFADHGCPRCEQTIARRRPTEPHMHMCALCGHLGANDADHVVPLAVDPYQPVDARLIQPAHGTSRRCPQCVDRSGRPRACNQSRGTATPAATAPLVTSRDW
jgi:hypothetical protein